MIATLLGAAGCATRHPFVPELLQRLVQCAELTVLPAVEKQLRRASAPTLKRLLAPALPVGDQLRTVGRGSP